MRYGQDLLIHDDDPRVSVWAPGSGLLFDALLLVFLTLHLKLVYTPDGRVAHEGMQAFVQGAKERGKVSADAKRGRGRTHCCP